MTALIDSESNSPASSDLCESTFSGEPRFLPHLRELLALAGTGLGFTRDVYDRERYERIGAIAQALISSGFRIEERELTAAFETGPGYVTPKIDVRGAVVRDNKILLVKEISDGLWALPGGFADVNYSPAEAIEAEIVQESGFTAKATKLAAVLDRRRHHATHPQLLYCYKFFFVCDLTGGEARPSLETSEVDFFSENALPSLSLGRSTAAQIAMLFEHYRNPTLPTIFD